MVWPALRVGKDGKREGRVQKKTLSNSCGAPSAKHDVNDAKDRSLRRCAWTNRLKRNKRPNKHKHTGIEHPQGLPPSSHLTTPQSTEVCITHFSLRINVWESTLSLPLATEVRAESFHFLLAGPRSLALGFALGMAGYLKGLLLSLMMFLRHRGPKVFFIFIISSDPSTLMKKHDSSAYLLFPLH